jgi:hypothetical protein
VITPNVGEIGFRRGTSGWFEIDGPRGNKHFLECNKPRFVKWLGLAHGGRGDWRALQRMGRPRGTIEYFSTRLC